MKKRLSRNTAVAACAAMVLTGCTVGPNFKAPVAPGVSSYTASQLPAKTTATATEDGAAQHLDFNRQLSAQWWTMFRSPQLDALIARGIANNPSLTAAEAAVREARENLRAAGGELRYPTVDGNLSLGRQKVSAASNGVGGTYSLIGASVSVSYALDFFGGNRRQLEGLAAQVDYQRYRYEAAYLTLTGNLATTAIQEASLRAQIGATNEIVAAEQRQLDLIKRQFQLGAVPKTSVLSQQTQLAKTRATLSPLKKQLAYTRHALAALAGQMPGQGGLPIFTLASLNLPENLPVSLPSALVRQRPDILASEALFHQAATAVGVATANLYPKVTLTAGFGGESNSLGDLFDNSNTIWNLGGGLLQPLFHAGALKARQRAAVDAYKAAGAQYRQTVLTAFQNVADVLRALDTDAQTLRDQAEAEKAAKATLELTRRQFQLGAVSYLTLLVAQRDYQQGRIGLVTARAQRYADTAALFQSLGGGWWNRPEAAPGSTKAETTTSTAHESGGATPK